jgi:hypothetical protein
VPDLVISVERDTDLLQLDFSFFGFAVDARSVPRAIVANAPDSVVTVQFPPQAIAEANYFWNGDDLPVDPPPVLSDLAGPSRLCFSFAEGASIPLPNMTQQDLLDWSGWALAVPPVAQVQSNQKGRFPTPRPPLPQETVIEFPYALYLAPTVFFNTGPVITGFSTEFVSRKNPLQSPNGVVDLWSTSLSGGLLGPQFPQLGTPEEFVPQVSAVWAADNAELSPDATPEFQIQYEKVQ